MSTQTNPKWISYPQSLGKEVAQGQHYMLIDSYESKTAVDKEGNGTRKSSIALYIPPGALTTTYGQNYEQMKGGATLAAGAGAFGEAFGGTNTTGVNLGDFVKESLSGVVNKAQPIADFQAATRGMAKNNHVAMLYRGPSEFRTHTFTFSFWPKDDTEADIVKNIIQEFKIGSTPTMAGLSGSTMVTKLMAPYFKSPRHWEIKFCKGAGSSSSSPGTNSYLFTIGRSVITTMTVNHDPDSVVSFHADGVPAHSTLAVTFQEITYVASNDTEDSLYKEAEKAYGEAQEQLRKSEQPASDQINTAT